MCLAWRATGRWLSLSITDRGTGLRGDVEPFLPFTTSKADGSGIGLALCREVADAHGAASSSKTAATAPAAARR